MGFWAALHEVYRKTRAQRCWIHKAANVRNMDRVGLLAFYEFPAEHWKRIRINETKGCVNRQTALAMTHLLMMPAKKKWRTLEGQNRQPKIIAGAGFQVGIKHELKAA